MTGSEEHGRSESGRLENGMKTGAVETATHERDIGKGIQIAKNADSIDKDDVAPFGSTVESINTELLVGRPLLDGPEMRDSGLVRRNHESKGAKGAAKDCKGGQKHSLVSGPSGARDKGWPRRSQPAEQGRRAINQLGALPDLIIARVTGDHDNITSHAQLHEALRVLGVYGPDRIEERVGILKESGGDAGAPRRGSGERGADEAKPDA